jgi:hypothetical protein
MTATILINTLTGIAVKNACYLIEYYVLLLFLLHLLLASCCWLAGLTTYAMLDEFVDSGDGVGSRFIQWQFISF